MKFLKNGQKGQGIAEYLLILVMVSVVTAVILALDLPASVWISIIGIAGAILIVSFLIFRGSSKLPTTPISPTPYNGKAISWWEYVLIFVLVGVVVLVILTLIGPAISNLASPSIKISP